MAKKRRRGIDLYFCPIEVDAFFASVKIVTMTQQQISIYTQLMLRQWPDASCSIPSDPAEAAELIVGKKDASFLSDVAHVLDACFVPLNGAPQRARNEKLFEVRERMVKRYLSKSRGASKREKAKRATRLSGAQKEHTKSINGGNAALGLNLDIDLRSKENGEPFFELPKHCPELPPSLNTELGRMAISEWAAYKRERSEALKSSRTWKSILEEFQDLGDAELAAAVKFSMGKSWAGLFRDKSRKSSKHVPVVNFGDEGGAL